MNMRTREEDERWMRRCLHLARKGIGRVSPNPAVGAVLVSGGKVLGEGFHAFFGGPHAEAACLARVSRIPRNAVLYVNLEPCTHFGKTPPCTELIRGAGIRRVVIGMTDPNPIVAGGGVRKLRASGISVTTGVCERECATLNRFFLKNMATRLPYIHLKVAISIDGKLAGSRQWVSSKQSRILVHRARALHDAVLVGAGTVVSDDPRLDVRYVRGRNPVAVVLDGRLRSPVTARVFSSAGRREVILCTTSRAERQSHEKVRILRRLGVRVLGFATRDERIPLRRLCQRLYEMNIGSVLIEGGEQISGTFFAAGLVDELSAYVAPTVIGGTVHAFRINKTIPLLPTQQRPSDSFVSKVGRDLVISHCYNQLRGGS